MYFVKIDLETSEKESSLPIFSIGGTSPMLKVHTEEGKIFFFVKLFSVGNIKGLFLRLLNTKSCTKLSASNTTLNSLLRKFTLNLLRIYLKENQTISMYYFYLLQSHLDRTTKSM